MVAPPMSSDGLSCHSTLRLCRIVVDETFSMVQNNPPEKFRTTTRFSNRIIDPHSCQALTRDRSDIAVFISLKEHVMVN